MDGNLEKKITKNSRESIRAFLYEPCHIDWGVVIYIIFTIVILCIDYIFVHYTVLELSAKLFQ